MDETKQATRSLFGALGVAAFLSLGCFTLPWNQDERVDRPDLSGLECGTFQGTEPTMGYFWNDVEPLGSGCDDVPIEPGFQGGFHITPVLWAPAERIPAGSGVTTVTLTFTEDPHESIEIETEFFDDYWVDRAGGMYHSQRIVLPNEIVEEGVRMPVQIDYIIDFDNPDNEDLIVTRETELYL